MRDVVPSKPDQPTLWAMKKTTLQSIFCQRLGRKYFEIRHWKKIFLKRGGLILTAEKPHPEE